MNNFYNDIQVTKTNRRMNDVTACKIVEVTPKFGIRLEVAKNQTIELMPKDFEVFEYKPGMWVAVSYTHLDVYKRQLPGRR